MFPLFWSKISLPRDGFKSVYSANTCQLSDFKKKKVNKAALPSGSNLIGWKFYTGSVGLVMLSTLIRSFGHIFYWWSSRFSSVGQKLFFWHSSQPVILDINSTFHTQCLSKAQVHHGFCQLVRRKRNFVHSLWKPTITFSSTKSKIVDFSAPLIVEPELGVFLVLWSGQLLAGLAARLVCNCALHSYDPLSLCLAQLLVSLMNACFMLFFFKFILSLSRLSFLITMNLRMYPTRKGKK